MIQYSIIENIPRDRLESVSFHGEEFKQLLKSPYLVSNMKRIWYNNTIYYNITLDDFFKYVLHEGEEDYD